MTAQNQASTALQNRIDEYATWVNRLRTTGKSADRLETDASDPLTNLGQELELLANALTRREQEVHQLFELVESAEKGLAADDVLNRIFDGFAGLIPFDRIGCAFVVAGNVVAYWARSQLGPPQITPGYSQPLSGSSLEKIISTGEPRIINDLEDYLRNKPQSNSTRRVVQEGGRSNLTCPLLVDQRPVGFLFFTSKQKNTYSGLHQAVFRQIASQVSVVIEKSRVFEQMVERNRQLQRESKGFEIAANYDALTKAMNRGAIMCKAEQAMKDAATSHKSVGAIMVDIDHFKLVNDTYGHDAGDKALKEVSRRLTAALRPADQFGRYGGEEFLVIVTDASRDIVFEVAERLRREVAASPIDLGSCAKTITASFGASISSGPGETAAELITSADQALYAAKNSGRNKVAASWDVIKT